MKTLFLIILIIFFLLILVFLYCSLVLAKEADKMIEKSLKD